MAHEVFGERFFGLRVPAWHRIGTVVEEAVPASKAIEMVGLDYGVTKEPLFLPDGTQTDYSAIVRDATEDAPEREVFGVGKDYELIHVTDIAAQLDSFPWPVTSAGALRRGAEVFICYDLGDKDVLGEQYNMHLAVAHPYQPGQAWRAMLTPTRVVCQNTMILGERLATANFRVEHSVGAKTRVDAALVQAQAEAMEDRAIAAVKHLGEIKVTKPKLSRIIDIADMPVPTGQWDEDTRKAQEARHQRYKDGVIQFYDRFCDEQSQFGGTGYALYNAMVEYADWRDGRGDEARLAENSLVGGRAAEKKRAYKAILQVAG